MDIEIKDKGLKMKKILCGTLLALSSALAVANTPVVDPQFAKVETLIKANNFDQAYKELQSLSKAGNGQATYNLGYLTQTGKGTQADPKKAVELYDLAGKQGYALANYILSQGYAAGSLGLTKSPAKATEYLDKAAKQGFEEAIVEQAVILFAQDKPESNKQALAKLDPLIKKGSYSALYSKAIYDLSVAAKTNNRALGDKALGAISSLAQKNFIPALLSVGNMYANGDIVPQNLPEAKKIFSALAQQNVPSAKEKLEIVNKAIADQAKNPPKANAAPKKS